MHVFLPYNGVFRGKSIIGNICALLVAGLTGWAQINGRDELPIPVKFGFDEYYYKNKSFLLDMKILFLTFVKVIRSERVEH